LKLRVLLLAGSVLLLVLASLLLPAAAAAEDTRRLAVLELRSSGEFSRSALNMLSDQLRDGALKATKGSSYEVMTRENMEVLARNMGIDLAACDDQGQCEVDVGKNVGADTVLSGEIGRFGSKLTLTIKLHNTHKGSLLNTETVRATTKDELFDSLSAAAATLVREGLGLGRRSGSRSSAPSTASISLAEPDPEPAPLTAVIIDAEPVKTPSPPPVSVITQLAQKPAVAATPAPAQQEVQRGRWAALLSSGMAVDIFGPVHLAGEEVWYVENGRCLSVIQHDPSLQQWVESIWIGDCTPWEEISIEVRASTLILNDANSKMAFDFIEPASSDLKNGLYTGDLGVNSDVSSNTEPIILSLSDRRKSLIWGKSSCEGELGTPRIGADWIQFTERLQTGQDICIDGGKVTVMTLSSDAILVLWSGKNRLATGILRRER
jgi:hypothetical protein